MAKRNVDKKNEVAAQDTPAKMRPSAADHESTMHSVERVKNGKSGKYVNCVFSKEQHKALKISAAHAEKSMSRFIQDTVLEQMRKDGYYLD